MTTSPYRVLIALALAYVALTPAITIGSVWNLKAHPVENVDVTLHGKRLHGRLSRDWSTDWVLVDDDGSTIHFRDFDAMAFHPPKSRPSPWQSWRAMVPFLIVAMAALVLAFGRTQRLKGEEVSS